MVYKIITCSQLIENPIFKTFDDIIIFDYKDTTKNIDQIKAIKSNHIEIYDLTYSANHNHNDLIPVSDHINKTGQNPLIGNQQKIDKPFVDISNLYQSKKGVTTDCLGKHFSQHKKEHLYPSTHLCHIAIIARAVNKKTITAFLINDLGENKNA